MNATPRLQRARRGSIVVLAAFSMVGLMALLAFALDLGVVLVARSELQRCADASAIAAAWELIDESPLTGGSYSAVLASNAQARASEYAGLNQVLVNSPSMATGDIEVGYLADPTVSTQSIDLSGNNHPNTVHVVVRREAGRNGEITMTFGRLLGRSSTPAVAEATAALLTSFQGFRAPSDGGNLDLLPFALDKTTWDNMLDSNVGSDNYKWDALNQQVVSGSDGILEVNLYPQGTGSPGNRGTVDIGSSNNSTCDIARQITTGISPADLQYHGGSLEFDASGNLYLNGDTGISAGVKDELASIKGQPRIIPIFTAVNGPGNNAEYTIVRFTGIRIMAVKLTGKASSKYVMVQPANIVTKGGIPGGNATSDFVFSPVRLVR